MVAFLYAIIIMLVIYSIWSSSFVTLFGNQSNSINSSVSTSFADDLKSKIHELVSDGLNDTDNILNSSLLTNGSNLTSSNIMISNNKVISSVNNNGTDSSSSSLVKNQVKTINGVCTSTNVGGNGNDTLTSSGNCNDKLTGGLGADKFMCGEGTDIVRDYNPEDGDILLDKQNCEKILE